MTKEPRRYFGRSAILWWCIGYKEMVEWSEWKRDHLYNMAERYEEEAAKASNELHKIIGPSDLMKYHWRRYKLEEHYGVGGSFETSWKTASKALWQQAFLEWRIGIRPLLSHPSFVVCEAAPLPARFPCLFHAIVAELCRCDDFLLSS